jgi:AAA family ATP:ADP antiporter
VRAGEGAAGLLLGLNSFLLLMSYYLLKTVREPLILTQGRAEVKTYSAAAQALLLLAIVPAYGALASRVSRIRLITRVTLIFVRARIFCEVRPMLARTSYPPPHLC